MGEVGALESVRARIDALCIEDCVKLAERFLPYEEALTRIREADCGVVPNLPSALNDLTLSGKLLDYALLGIPAVVAELEVQKAHFSGQEVTFFPSGDAHALADAIRWVAAHPEEARAKAARARARAAEYAWPRQRDTYQRLLRGLASTAVEPRAADAAPRPDAQPSGTPAE